MVEAPRKCCKLTYQKRNEAIKPRLTNKHKKLYLKSSEREETAILLAYEIATRISYSTRTVHVASNIICNRNEQNNACPQCTIIHLKSILTFLLGVDNKFRPTFEAWKRVE